MAKKSKRKFYKTIFTFVVLSEDEINPNTPFDDTVRETQVGDVVGYVAKCKTEVLNSEQIIEELNEAGSDSSFFQLNKDDSDDEWF